MPEGFVTVTTINVKDINGEWKAVSANVLIDGNYMIVEKYESHLPGEFKDGDIVKCEESDEPEYYHSRKNTPFLYRKGIFSSP